MAEVSIYTAESNKLVFAQFTAEFPPAGSLATTRVPFSPVHHSARPVATLHSLSSIQHALCAILHTLCTILDALCTILNALYTILHAPCAICML